MAEQSFWKMAAQPLRDFSSGADRRFWALDFDQSTRVLSLYDKGRSLMASYLRIKQEIEMNTQRVLRESREQIDEEVVRIARGSEPQEVGALAFSIERGQQAINNGHTYQRLDQELTDIDKQLDSVATACSEAELCPALTESILSRLPRELRDQIYDHLWSDDHVERLDEALSFFPLEIQFKDSPAVDLPDFSVPLFANARFVGTDFASEVAVRYFTARTAAEIDYRCVRAHLNRNHFGPMHFPFKEAIRNLVISAGDNPCCRTIPVNFPKRALEDSLDSLFMLKDNRDVKIGIYLPSRMQFQRSFFEFLEVARPFFPKFRDANMDVKFLGYDFFNPSDEDSKNVFSEQLNHYFDGTPEEWLDMKAKEIKEIPDAKERRACRGILRAMRMSLGFYHEGMQHYEAAQAA